MLGWERKDGRVGVRFQNHSCAAAPGTGDDGAAAGVPTTPSLEDTTQALLDDPNNFDAVQGWCQQGNTNDGYTQADSALKQWAFGNQTGHGWRICGQTVDKCKTECVRMGGCAGIYVAENKCCFPYRSSCSGRYCPGSPQLWDKGCGGDSGHYRIPRVQPQEVERGLLVLAAKECCADTLGKCATDAATSSTTPNATTAPPADPAAASATSPTAASATTAATTTAAAVPAKGTGTGTGGPQQGGNLITKRRGLFLATQAGTR